ncbi:hypothetical protein IC235_00990 [Hymenobacter sp. BT664]|uniref:Uncharacterized protein n=2 Tax=Hymenobacter montanus TaxID=2771359 RepID=A0A927GHJ0_9BACT|nr:hypothetical protein [Hymenobacter montanus]
MYLLKRTISPYLGEDLIIGIFQQLERAKEARKEYIMKCRVDDKWAEQPYREVHLENDTTIYDTVVIHETERINKEVYVVSLYEEGFGQIIREVCKVFNDENEARDFTETMNKNDKEYEPSWYDLEALEVDKIYYDK